MNLPQGVILVTGSSGLIGSAVIKRLARDFQVVGFDREGDPYPPTEAECVCVDVTSEESVQAGLSRLRYAYGEHVTSVIHLAAYYDFSAEPSPKYEAVTVQGTERLLRGLHDFQVEQFIFSSTMLVHAPSQPGERINEEWPLEPKWPYPESKLKTEELIRAQRGTIPVVFLRIAGVYDDLCHSIPLAHQIQRIFERQFTSHFFPGHPAHGQAFLHLDDLVEVFAHGLNAPELKNMVLKTGLGNDRLRFYDSNFSLPQSGQLKFFAGPGNDTIEVRGDRDMTLTNAQLSSSAGGAVLQSGVENTVLRGGQSAAHVARDFSATRSSCGINLE